MPTSWHVHLRLYFTALNLLAGAAEGSKAEAGKTGMHRVANPL